MVSDENCCHVMKELTDRRTDNQTDGQLTIAIVRFALHASREKVSQQFYINFV